MNKGEIIKIAEEIKEEQSRRIAQIKVYNNALSNKTGERREILMKKVQEAESFLTTFGEYYVFIDHLLDDSVDVREGTIGHRKALKMRKTYNSNPQYFNK